MSRSRGGLAGAIILLGIALLAGVWYFRYREDSEKYPKEEVIKRSSPIRVMDPVEANNLHVPLADQLGYFQSRGLNVEVSGTSAGKFAMDALNAGGVDYAVVVEMNVAQTLFQHDDIAILCEIAEPTRAIKVLGRRDRGIEGPEDIRGKKIGVLFGVNIHLFITRYLEDLGVSSDEVELVNLRPPDAVAAFRKGDVDVVITWQPHVHKLQDELGENVIVLTENASKYWTYKMILVTKRSYLERHRSEASEIVSALVQADEFIRDNRDEAIGILSKHINLNSDSVESFFDEIDFEVRITARLLEMIAVEVDWLSGTMLQGREPVTRDFHLLISDELRDVDPARFRLQTLKQAA